MEAMAFLFIHVILSLFLSVLLLFYSVCFATMFLLYIHIVLILFLSVLLLVPYQAQSRSITKIDSGLPLLEEEEVAVGKEEEAQAQSRSITKIDSGLPLLEEEEVAVGKEEEAQRQPHMLERFFHRRLLEYPCLTPDPALPDFLNVTVLSLEVHPWPWQERAVSHPTSFHLATLARARHAHRTNLMLFAGGGRPYIRGSIRAECQNRTDICEVVNCSEGIGARAQYGRSRPGPLPALCGGGVRDDEGGVGDDEGATRKGKRGCFSSFKRKAKKALLFSVKKFGKLCHRSSGDGKSRKKRTPVPAYCIPCFNFPSIPPDSPVLLDARLLSRLCEVPP